MKSTTPGDAGQNPLPQLLEAAAGSLPEHDNALARARAFAEPLIAGETVIGDGVVVGEGAEAITPCGGCRQKLREFASDDTPVWSADRHAITARHTLGALLPASFGPDHLKDASA